MYQLLALLAIYIKPPPPTSIQDYPSPSNIFFDFLFVLIFLALVGVLLFGTWMFRTGRWQVQRVNSDGSNEVQSVPYGDVLSSISERQEQENNLSFEQTVSPVTSSTHRDPFDEPNLSNSPNPGVSTLPVAPLQPSQVDEPLKNRPWLGLAENCVNLFDELDKLMPELDASRQEIAKHVEIRLRESLINSGAEIISSDRTFDEHRHQLEGSNSSVPRGTAIIIISPGFAIQERVLRRAIVRPTSNSD